MVWGYGGGKGWGNAGKGWGKGWGDAGWDGFGGFEGGWGSGGGGFGGGMGGLKGLGKMGNMAAVLGMVQEMMKSGGASGSISEEKDGVNYKSDLAGIHGRTIKSNEKIPYEVEEVDVGGKRNGYQATVTINGTSYSGEPAANKKQAEQNAAKVALEEVYNGGQAPSGGSNKKKQQEANKKKRKSPADTEELNFKSKLIHGIQIFLNHQAEQEGSGKQLPSKDQITYEIQENEVDGKKQYVATVTIKATDTTCEGEPKSDKKEAEQAAAEVAYNQLKDQLAPLEEEHKAKKAKKAEEDAEKRMALFQEKKAQRDAQRAEKKAAKEAEKEAKKA